MIYEKATAKDMPILTDLRIAYLQEDLGAIEENDLQALRTSLPGYYEKHLNKDLLVYVAREEDTIVSCAFFLIVEKPFDAMNLIDFMKLGMSMKAMGKFAAWRIMKGKVC